MNAHEQMHAALELVNEIYVLLSKPCIVIEEVRQVCQKARAVLISMPQRNCDVGTADEQSERFDKFCDEQCMKSCKACPVYKEKITDTECFSRWAQMPYEAKEEGDGR